MIDTYPSNQRVIRILGIMLLHLVQWPLFSLALAQPVQLLWNWFMPAIFDLPAITFWQVAGLMLLVIIRFRRKLSIKTNETKS